MTSMEIAGASGESRDVYFEAAKAIAEADFLFVGTGAGFSADSGLAVYNDVAKHELYKQLGLDYIDLADPAMLRKNPELFHGFWLSCANDYRNVQPHDGYYIIKKWKEQLFTAPYEMKKMNSKESIDLLVNVQTNNGTTVTIAELEEGEKESAESQQKPFQQRKHNSAEFYDKFYAKQVEHLKNFNSSFLEAGCERGYAPVHGVAGPFFVFTSNVDGHFQRMFNNHEVFEIHGSIDYFQCSKQCTRKAWPLPMEKRFKISKEMTVVKEQLKECTVPFDEAKGIAYDSFDSYTVPICQYCGADARPNILLFGDSKWFTTPYPSQANNAWKSATLTMVEENPNLKVAIIEIGAGDNVPSVRYECSNFFEDANYHRNGSTSFIRINPEIPEYVVRRTKISFAGLKQEAPCMDKFISIKSKGLPALQKIDEQLETILKKNKMFGL